ncbi:MAG: hypothetical protein HYS25_00900 [Ignavibacteriales bacterium]|nr:hypothetical protein [Ignavibacteriales bacterium]
MKKKIFPPAFFLIAAAIGLFLLPPLSIAQAADEVVQQIDQPSPVDLSDMFTSLSGLSAAVLFFTSYAKKIIKTAGAATIVMSAIVSFILSGTGLLLGFGIFAMVKWYYILIYGLAATFMANGLSTWGFISDLLVFLKLKVPKNSAA